MVRLSDLQDFSKKLSSKEKVALASKGYWFCCRTPGFDPAKRKDHRRTCVANKTQTRSVATLLIEDVDSDRYAPLHLSSAVESKINACDGTVRFEKPFNQLPVGVLTKEKTVEVQINGKNGELVDCFVPAVQKELSKLVFQVDFSQKQISGQSSVLVDSGAQANLISRKLVEENRLKTRRGSKLKIRTADGSVSSSRDRVLLIVSRGDYSHLVEFLVADIIQDLILGTPWLSTVEVFHLQPREGSLKFRWNSQEYSWTTIAQEVNHGVEQVCMVEIPVFEEFCTHGDVELYELQLAEKDQQIDVAEGEVRPDPDIQALLEEYKDVFAEPTGPPPSRPEDHQIELLPDARMPGMRGIGRLDETKLKVLRETLDTLLSKGFIKPSSSPFGANILFARKPDGSFRLCVDYRGLNAITKKNAAPLPNLQEMKDRLIGNCIFTKMDLRDGFYNVLMDPSDQCKTAFRTRYGHFEWVVLPMGLCNSPATFQTLMNRVFGDLYDRQTLVYLDDLLVYSKSMQEHLAALRVVLKRCRTHKLFLKLSKCLFAKEQVPFCGHIFSAAGIGVDPLKAATLQKLPLSNVKELQSFLGLVNWFKDFIPDYAMRALPLTKLLVTSAPWEWTKSQQEALEYLVNRIQSGPVLSHFNPNKKTVVFTDASDFAIGGWIGQLEYEDEESELKPVVFWSRKLQKAELNYAIPEKELSRRDCREQAI